MEKFANGVMQTVTEQKMYEDENQKKTTVRGIF